MSDDTLNDLSSFILELNHETDRGLPLVAAAVIDEKLKEILLTFMCDNKAARRLVMETNSPLASFSARIDACFALGLIDDFEFQEVTLIRRIRNAFAHERHRLTFSGEKVMGLCASLGSPLPESPSPAFVATPRTRFTSAIITVVLRLLYRARYVSKHRCELRAWPVTERRWRSMDEPVPQDSAYITIAKGGELRLVIPTKAQESNGDVD